MLPNQLFHQLELNGQRIKALVEKVSVEQARWKPDPSTWSILEVMRHLLDEEREDFRIRLEYILYHPGKPWPPIDPQGWVTLRNYNEGDLSAALASYLAERRGNLQWLEALTFPNWETTCPTPWGSIKAGDMLAAWTAHDLLHTRQLIELHYAWNLRLGDPYSPQYAGDW